MCTILAFVILCSSLYGQVVQTTPIVSNSPNSPYRQLSLLTKDVDRLKEELEILKNNQTLLEKENEKCLQQELEALKASCSNLEQKLEEVHRSISDIGTEKYELMQKELQMHKDFSTEMTERVKVLEEENEKLKNNNLQQELESLKISYANLEQKLEDTCHFVSDIGTEKYELMQKELQANKDLSAQIEQKILAVLADWCKQAEGKIDADHASLEEVKRSLAGSNDWVSSNAFVAFKNENEQHVRELIDFFAEEKIEQFRQKLNEQDQKIYQLSKSDGAQGNLKHSFQKIEKKLGEFCKTTCDETIRQVNDRLQNLAQQMQSGLDALSCAKCVQHTIVSGESLSSIAQRYRTTPAQIRAVNGLQNSKGLRVGDTILIPKNQ